MRTPVALPPSSDGKERAVTITRRRFKHRLTLEEQLVENAALLRDQATKPGVALDEVLRRIRQNETAAHISDWLESPGLRTPR
jgi:hypothetical protein